MENNGNTWTNFWYGTIKKWLQTHPNFNLTGLHFLVSPNLACKSSSYVCIAVISSISDHLTVTPPYPWKYLSHIRPRLLPSNHVVICPWWLCFQAPTERFVPADQQPATFLLHHPANQHYITHLLLTDTHLSPGESAGNRFRQPFGRVVLYTSGPQQELHFCYFINSLRLKKVLFWKTCDFSPLHRTNFWHVSNHTVLCQKSICHYYRLAK